MPNIEVVFYDRCGTTLHLYIYLYFAMLCVYLYSTNRFLRILHPEWKGKERLFSGVRMLVVLLSTSTDCFILTEPELILRDALHANYLNVPYVFYE